MVAGNINQEVADQTGIQTGNFVYGPGDIKFKDLKNDGKIDGGKGTLEDHGDLKVIWQLPTTLRIQLPHWWNI